MCRRRSQLDYWVAPPVYLGPVVYVESHWPFGLLVLNLTYGLRGIGKRERVLQWNCALFFLEPLGSLVFVSPKLAEAMRMFTPL